MTLEQNTHFCLNLACGSARGQVAAVSALLDRHGAYIEQFSVFDDHTTERFFVRSVFSLRSPVEMLRGAFEALAQDFPDAQWRVHDLAQPTRVLIMVSKFDHCLRELIAQWRRGELKMDIVAIVSNHADLAPLAAAEGLAFHHLPIDPASKPAQEAKLQQLVADTGAEFIVLARYMQILSEQLTEALHGRVINIHHSFLPGFKGGKPYQQAFDRGVKLIGATAHFATTDLDEGPIIEQSVERVDHADTPQHLSQAGRLVESLVLSRALRFVLERRVFINGMKTVVLR
ncbi:MAG: formyltetrahydrofolate deformylase [Rhodoferax sp.]|nr:formyltetrahydrofolate deformylase [Rhodoferax sp.]